MTAGQAKPALPSQMRKPHDGLRIMPMLDIICMKTKCLLLAAALGFAALPSMAQDQEKSAAPDKAPASDSAKPATPAAAPVSAEDLEAAFVETMANVLFQGRWSSIENGVLGPEKPEEYEIVGVMKTGGDRWVVNARIQYGKVNLVAPVPVQLKWAGDTPIMIVDKFTMPGAGTYSARVMVFENTYSGTWTAGDHGGLLHGLIVKKPAK